MSGQTPYMSAYGYPTNFAQRDNRYPTNSNVETAMELNRRPSLLAGYHNPYSSPERAAIPPYLFSLPPPGSMGSHVDEHSKRARYPPNIPLSIDVKKEQPLYQPQTEAISPIHDEPKLDSSIRDTAIIRSLISKLESEIEVTMKKLHRAKCDQNDLRNRADRSAAADEDDENDDRDALLKLSGCQTLIEKILHDNRKKAEDSERYFYELNNHMDLTVPLYQEPNDLGSMEHIRRQYMNVMKNRLINLFKKSREHYHNRRKFESQSYDQAYEHWQKSIDKDEKTILAKDISTYREIFEKTFAELRKAREDKEKKQNNPEQTTTTTNNTDQPTVNTNEQEIEPEEDYQKMKKASIIPPIMYDSWQRKHQYFNQNNFIRTDAARFYRDKTKMPFWSAEERQIFIEKFTQSPKNFGYISSFLENKTIEQCVQFYYMTKKTENYKNLLRKQTQAARRRAKQTTMTTTTVTSSTTIETTFVTKVTSSNTIVSSTSQQILGIGQDADRVDNDDDRHLGDSTENKTANKKCQFLSCTSGRKKNRKNRLRTFPNKWNELSKDQREDIRRILQIPADTQRCCTRCYDKLVPQIDERQIDEDETKKSSANKWTDDEVQKLNEAFDKYQDDWTQIAEYVQRSEEDCREYYLQTQRKTLTSSDDHNLDEDNGSVSGSEIGHIKTHTDDHLPKPINEDSSDSPHGMVIDENDEQSSIIEEKSSIPPTTNLTTINSLVEKEISKTLNETEKRAINASPERTISNNNNNNNNSSVPTPVQAPPPPLVNLHKSHSQQFVNKGSIMRGTPISSSTKPISIDVSPSAHPHSHHYSNHPSRNDYSHLKSPKILDRNLEQQHLLQQQQHHAAYMRHFNQQQYLQQKNATNKPDLSNTDTFETLRTDYATSKYLTTTHSPNHERSHRSPPQPSPSHSQQLLPPPTAIGPTTPNPSMQASHHQQAALLASHLINSGVHPQDLLASGILPYPSYYNSPFLIDPRYLHEYANSAAVASNNEQLLKAEQQKALRLSRHSHHPHGPSIPTHSSPPDPSKRHSHDLNYPSNDYSSSIWRTQNLPNQQMHTSMKLNSTTAKNPLLELNELSRHSSNRPAERNSRSPDDYHHRLNSSRSTAESPSVHFQRVEAHNHHKSSHDKSNLNLHYSEHSSDPNSLNYLRQTANLHKSQQVTHRSHQHPHRSLVPPIPSPQLSSHQAYLLHGHHHSPVENHSRTSYSSQQRSHHSNESNNNNKNSKEPISIQDFMYKNVNDFVASTNSDNKNSGLDTSTHESNRSHQVNNSDQPILLDGDDDSNSDQLNKSTANSDMPEKRRDSSIKKILSNQPLEKAEYVEINQKVQNSANNSTKLLSNNDLSNLERSNSLSGRTRSRGSITMRMLMGSSDIYADGKVQSNTTDESPIKRPKSPDNDKGEKLEYLIRDALDRECPPVTKRDEASSIFQTSQPTKRFRTSPNDDEPKQNQESTSLRDPFALQPHGKHSHQQSLSTTDPEKNWQSIIQQQQFHINAQFSSRPSGSITQGSPISLTGNSRLSKNEQSNSPPSSPRDQSPKGKLTKRVNQSLASSPTSEQEPSTSLKSPISNTPPPPPTASPTISNSSHSLKKRLINEYELEQQRNSPVISQVDEPITPVPPTESNGSSKSDEPTDSKPSEDAEPST